MIGSGVISDPIVFLQLDSVLWEVFDDYPFFEGGKITK